MRLQIFSDVHLDVDDAWAPRLAPGADAVVVAGDLCEGMERGFRWLREHLGGAVPIVFVPGNHEYFARVRCEERREGATAAQEHDITLLDDGVAVLEGVRFIGSTLWTDYELYGAERKDEMILLAGRRMMDHRRILEAPGRFNTPADALVEHRRCRAFIECHLARRHEGPTVVVTHHGPHRLSLAERYRDNHISAAFISDLSSMIDEHQPALWVHGHTHVSFDYRAGATRIVCNPNGYGDENPGFIADLLVEV